VTDQQFAELIREIRLLREALERRPAPRREAPVGPLLRAIVEHVEERTFTCFELTDHVEVAQAEALGAAIVAAVGSLSPRRLGKLLASVDGEWIDGLRVRRVGDAREGARWQVSRVSNLPNPGAFA
jgi:hypothetical protein